MRDFEARRSLRSPRTFTPFDAADCEQAIHRRFEQQAARRPEAVAVRLLSGDITYHQLNGAANRAARILLAALGSTQKPVALFLHQGYESVVWTLALLKAGLPYAPLDQRLPAAVLSAMAGDLDPAALLVAGSQVDLGRAVSANRFPVIDIAIDLSADAAGVSAGNLDRPASPDDVAYVFYTSGSTGRPKGVADSHRNVLHNVYRYTNTLRFAPEDRLSLVQNPSFSGTVSSLFGALLNGASVVPFDLQGDGLSSLSSAIRSAGVTVFHAVPTIFRGLSDPIDRFPDMRLVRLEGDRVLACDIHHFQSTFQEGCVLVNGLGATECGLVRQFFVDHKTIVDTMKVVPIGYAVPDVAVKIDDDEIVVQSRFLALGYWRNPVLSAQRFETLPDGIRQYRTGDRGKLLADDCLSHLGRVDHRVRIAGEFIDTDEIERLLLSVPGISQAVVHQVVDQKQEPRLCAYLVRDNSSTVTADHVREALSARIGQHAVPAIFMFLDELPLTKDLKVDRSRLPAPARTRPELANDYVPPATVLELRLAQVWSEVLEIDGIGVTDSLIALGGDSLRAARIVTRLTPICGDKIRITSLFEHSTIRALARELEADGLIVHPQPAAAGGDDHSIAIIGMACRFPGADSLDQFWSNLRSACESITFFGPGELDGGEREKTAPGLVLARGLLRDVESFDARLFGLMPRQAQMLDPQQRVWLECVYHAMEDAGIPVGRSEEHAGANIGVFAGARESSYLWHLVGGERRGVDALLTGSDEDALELLNSNDRDSIATRTSYLLGLTGPSINVQTACSTSLVAVAQACQALASGQCDVAIAGGVAVTFPQKRGHRHLAGSIYSRDGHCRPFDANASGTVFSDGAGVVVLKRLGKARADGDRIDAVIRGWAVNNDGSNKASFMAPSVQGQARVIAQAQDHAGVRPHEISYVETHGTGTPVGDPIEFAAFERAFRRGTDARGFCGLGSVKSNIGHADTAAGIAGLIKTVLALKHRELPATLHYQLPNPEIDLAASPFYVVDRLRSWTISGGDRIAGVSSLGVGGTNCHVIVAEAPALDEADAMRLPVHLVPISAGSAEALDALERNYRDFITRPVCPDLSRIAATAQRNRAHQAFRVAVRCESVGELRDALSAGHSPGASARFASGAAPGRWRGQIKPGTEARIGFLFAGQGSQHVGMGRALFQASPEFRNLLERCEQALRNRLDRPLLDVMFTDADGGSLIQRTEYAQPALFALEYSLGQLLRTWGIEPRVVIGHSIGEYAAACIAGVFTMEQGIVLAAERGRLMQALPGRGGMRAVAAGPDVIEDLLRPFASDLSIAAINAPRQTVLSGDIAALERLGAALQSRGISSRALSVSHAFHSAQIDPAMEPLANFVGRMQLKPPTLRLISNLTGRAVTNEVTDPRYWSAHAREPVLFAAGLQSLIDEGCDTLVEIGPDGLLSHLVPDDAGRRIETVATLRRGEHDWNAMLDTLARLYVRGARIDWRALQAGRTTRPVQVPTYPFQRARYWYDGPLAAGATRSTSSRTVSGHPLLGERLRLPGSSEIRFEVRFSAITPQFLADHRLFGVSLPPAASHLSMLAQAAVFLVDTPPGVGLFRFEALHLLRPLLLPEGVERDVQLICRPAPHGWSVELTSSEVGGDGVPAGEWTTHMIGRGQTLEDGEQSASHARLDLEAIRISCERRVSGTEFYTKVWANQGGTGSSFRWIESIWQGDRVALCRAVCPAAIVDPSAYRLHPGVIESACQVLHCCGDIETAEELETDGITYVPFSVDVFTMQTVTTDHDEVWCYAELRELTRENVIADLTIVSASGQVIATLHGFCLRPITREAVVRAVTGETRHHRDSRRESLSLDASVGTPATPRPSRADIEQQLVQIWENSLQIKPVAVTDNFFELGGDSLTAVRVFSRIETAFGKSLSIATLFQSPTVQALAARVQEQFVESPNACLVEMQRGDGGMPIFFVHGGGGNVVGFRELARLLGLEQRVFGIQARGLYDEHPPDTNVEEMAAHYVTLMKGAWPEGPYAIAGLSFGGVVAFEVARQLREDGARVALLALFDAPALGSHRLLPKATHLRRQSGLVGRRITYHARNLWRLPFGEKMDYLAGRAHTLRRRARSRLWQVQFRLYSALSDRRASNAPPSTDVLPVRFQNVRESLKLAARHYTPSPYAGTATLFRARENDAIFLVDPALGWSGLIQHLEIREVPGDHVTMLAQPHVRTLAVELKGYLDGLRESGPQRGARALAFDEQCDRR